MARDIDQIAGRVPVTMTLLVLGASAATLLDRLLPAAAPLLPALLVTAAWATGKAYARTGTQQPP
ncbi:hypothetical protein [Streptomyces salinarius]|uniref:hypothetical protein n=1 Tax=Streptomyces salinarius TaxID=2762598 RepID=UPI001647A464|nr:hypothetical protein [Streptomyces salinarius]